MKTEWTRETLQAFEKDIANTFNEGKIRAPVHLSGGNESVLIKLFERINPHDWVCGTWRAHFHSLLKGVSAGQLKQAILDGRSIALCFPQQKVICSALVAGIVPIALGLAWAAKRRGTGERVWCFVGDMAACAGLTGECARYARGHGLPLTLVVEDNGKSVATETLTSWGGETPTDVADTTYYYELKPWPHVGTGRWIHMQ